MYLLNYSTFLYKLVFYTHYKMLFQVGWLMLLFLVHCVLRIKIMVKSIKINPVKFYCKTRQVISGSMTPSIIVLKVFNNK